MAPSCSASLSQVRAILTRTILSRALAVLRAKRRHSEAFRRYSSRVLTTVLFRTHHLADPAAKLRRKRVGSFCGVRDAARRAFRTLGSPYRQRPLGFDTSGT